MNAPFGVILAGGQGSRMGGADKALLRVQGQTLIARAIERLSPQVANLAINANGDATRFNDMGLPVVADSIAGFPGPLAGVLAGLDWAAAQGADTIVTVAADTPFFPCDLVPRLQMASEGMAYPLVLATTPRGTEQTRSMTGKAIRHPTFGLWPVDLRDDLRRFVESGQGKVVLWTEQHGGREALFPNAGDPFFNVNTPDDLAAAEQRA